MQDRGMWLRESNYIDTKDEAGRAKFREKLSTQIHMLTGVKPRMEEKLNDKKEKLWAIFRK